MIEFTERELLTEHVRGDSYRAIGVRHGISHETARKLVIAQGTQYVNEIEMSLYLADKLESIGGVGEWPTLLVPHQAQGDWQTALSLLQWTVDRLRARSVAVAIRSRPTPAGTAFQLTLGEDHDRRRHRYEP